MQKKLVSIETRRTQPSSLSALNVKLMQGILKGEVSLYCLPSV